MGLIYVEIDLINLIDKENARRGILDPDEVKKIGVSALVDTGALNMTINENIQEYLQLPVIGKRHSQLANGKVLEHDVVGGLEVRYKNHTSHCTAVVMPGDSEPLLGAIPMEDMRIIIDPERQELTANPKPAPLVGLRPVK